ncbi:glycosyltransferase family 1 protein [Muribaculaceae bacterium Isolate-113 (HZI)]|nr:glycosyltransferase family 1 protein [Muribaculaceae bacterium Isolate-113 (HZI)]
MELINFGKIFMSSEKGKIKLLIVNTVPTDKNGITNVIFNLLEAMDRKNMTIGYVSINDPEEYYKERLNKIGVTLHVIRRKISSPWHYIKKLTRIAREYDIMHAHGNSATMVLEMIAAKSANVKVRAAHSHNTKCNMKVIDALSRPVFYRLCNLRMACGQDAGRWLFGNKFFHIINNGIDTHKYEYNAYQRDIIRQSLDVQDKFVIGHIGNFTDAKNHSFLIDVFAEYYKTNNRSVLILLGDGILREDIEKKVINLELKHSVIFIGSVNNPEDYMNAMDIIIMPSKHEGLPLTLIEEQANGLKIIASDNITADANLTGLISYLSLTNGTIRWAESIKNTHSIIDSRNMSISKDAIHLIETKDYDIFGIANKLKNIYFRALS